MRNDAIGELLTHLKSASRHNSAMSYRSVKCAPEKARSRWWRDFVIRGGGIFRVFPLQQRCCLHLTSQRLMNECSGLDSGCLTTGIYNELRYFPLNTYTVRITLKIYLFNACPRRENALQILCPPPIAGAIFVLARLHCFQHMQVKRN